ncbi:hypothetical protein L0Y65_05290 [Candidatus Micrarchaeota archaeon]|nr:hypothetical protein [Candidatus Micrarchaeota archaeon]
MANVKVKEKAKEGLFLGIDKKYWVGGAAVLAILMFMLEPFQWGSYNSGPGPATPSGQNVSGSAVFNGTIRTYDPMLLLPLDTSQAVIDSLRLHDGVRDIQKQENSYYVTTETRDDVYPIATWLRGMNVTGYAIANVAVSEDIIVDTVSGKITTSMPSGVVRVVTEPLLDADSAVTVSMDVVLRDKAIIDYSSASFTLQAIEALLDAKVVSLDGTSYKYSVPWAERNRLGNVSEYGEAQYQKVDSIIFSPQLTVGQIMVKKQFSYITYIDSGSAQVAPYFDNVTELWANFADTPYTLPASTLVIVTNRTPELDIAPDSVRYLYTLSLSDSPYDFGAFEPLQAEGADEYEINSTLKLNVSALALGDRIISIRRVLLPS